MATCGARGGGVVAAHALRQHGGAHEAADGGGGRAAGVRRRDRCERVQLLPSVRGRPGAPVRHVTQGPALQHLLPWLLAVRMRLRRGSLDGAQHRRSTSGGICRWGSSVRSAAHLRLALPLLLPLLLCRCCAAANRLPIGRCIDRRRWCTGRQLVAGRRRLSAAVAAEEAEHSSQRTGGWDQRRHVLTTLPAQPHELWTCSAWRIRSSTSGTHFGPYLDAIAVPVGCKCGCCACCGRCSPAAGAETVSKIPRAADWTSHTSMQYALTLFQVHSTR